MTTVQLNFRLPKDLKRAAQRVALERDESLSEVIRAALRDYVAQYLKAERNCS